MISGGICFEDDLPVETSFINTCWLRPAIYWVSASYITICSSRSMLMLARAKGYVLYKQFPSLEIYDG
jgi:hypothetical protein